MEFGYTILYHEIVSRLYDYFYREVLKAYLQYAQGQERSSV
ncbi:hypothetical protein DSUL_50083 [Desulfovibrionales bacterium]